MITISMNSENSKTSSPHSLVLILTDRIDLKGGDGRVALSKRSIIRHGRSHTKTINSYYQEQHGTKNLSCQTDPILYQILKIILSRSSKMHQMLIKQKNHKFT